MQSFTERPELWKDLEEKLQIRHGKARVPYAVALQGLGGVGKSQLALKYAESKRDRYNPILWIDATDEESARSSFGRCAAELGLSGYQEEKQRTAITDDRAVQRVLQWLRDRKETDDEWLVIVDNADDARWGIKDAMPKGSRGTIIITSQDNQSHMLIPGACERVDVGVMSSEEGVMLLCQRLNLRNGAVTEAVRILCAKLADDLGHLPLAIDLAAVYIGNNLEPPEIALSQYLKDFTTHRDEILRMDELRGLMGTKKTVWTAWDTTLQMITKHTPLPLLLLRLLAQFEGTVIYDEIFNLAALGLSSLHGDLVKDGLADEISIQLRQYLSVKEGKWDSFLYRQHRELLVRYGLLQQVEGDWGGVTMHQLVKWRVIQNEEKNPWLWRYMVHILAAACCQVTKAAHPPVFRKHLAGHLPDVDTISTLMIGDGEKHRDFACRAFCRAYIQEVQEGEDKEATSLFVQWMKTRETNFAAYHHDTLSSMRNRESTHLDQGTFEKSGGRQVQVMES